MATVVGQPSTVEYAIRTMASFYHYDQSRILLLFLFIFKFDRPTEV